jgi:hypothetical protein
MPNAKNTTYLERREKAHTINALVRIRNTTKERRERIIHRNL